MNRFRTPVLAALALIACTAVAQASVTVEKPFQQSYPLKSGGELIVSNTNGGITVEAWDRAEVSVNAVTKIKAPSSEKAEEIAKQIKIDVRQSAGSVRIETKLPRSGVGGGFLDWLTGNDASASVTYKIKAPRDVVAKLESTNGGLRLVGTRGRANLETVNGGVTVEHTEGDVQVETVNGGITVIEAAGALEGSTTNGGITAQLTRVDGDINLETTNGSVVLKVPRDLRANLDVATSNGGIHSDLEVAGGGKGRKHLTGEVNGGGGLLKVRTTNGGVRIEAE
jgi:DUF4097 and DUF4098 domain-containing protein YvlB